ncbi:MAG: hypothetical protein GY856_04855 [bacterium]|nr:hypothetical protein [bacterium]
MPDPETAPALGHQGLLYGAGRLSNQTSAHRLPRRGTRQAWGDRAQRRRRTTLAAGRGGGAAGPLPLARQRPRAQERRPPAGDRRPWQQPGPPPAEHRGSPGRTTAGARAAGFGERRGHGRPSALGHPGEELTAALRAHRWRVRDTADALGISRAALYKRMEQSSALRKASELGREEVAACHERCAGDVDAMVDALQVSKPKPALRRRMRQLGFELARLPGVRYRRDVR